MRRRRPGSSRARRSLGEKLRARSLRLTILARLRRAPSRERVVSLERGIELGVRLDQTRRDLRALRREPRVSVHVLAQERPLDVEGRLHRLDREGGRPSSSSSTHSDRADHDRQREHDGRSGSDRLSFVHPAASKVPTVRARRTARAADRDRPAPATARTQNPRARRRPLPRTEIARLAGLDRVWPRPFRLHRRRRRAREQVAPPEWSRRFDPDAQTVAVEHRATREAHRETFVPATRDGRDPRADSTSTPGSATAPRSDARSR